MTPESTETPIPILRVLTFLALAMEELDDDSARSLLIRELGDELAKYGYRIIPESTEPRTPVIVEQDDDWVRVRLGAESTMLKPSEATALAYELFGAAKDTTQERWARLAEGATYE